MQTKFQWAAALTAASLLSCFAYAANAVPPDAKKAEAKAADISQPEDIELQTADGLTLTLTYYHGTKGKQSIPIVLLHSFKQTRNDFKGIAPALQALGYAVIVPDLRGHGESTHIKGGQTLNAANMPISQFAAMVTKDMSAVKDFLWERNNAGELNIDKLCVVGAEMGASVALNFAWADAVQQDQNRVFGADREFKLGRFVKALVLISPERSFHGLPILAATKYPAVQSNIPMMIIVGKKDSKAMEESKRIHAIFEKYHPDPTGDDKLEKKTLFFGKLDTSLQGAKLLDPKFNVPAAIAEFIDHRLVKSEESKAWTWRERKRPHE